MEAIVDRYLSAFIGEEIPSPLLDYFSCESIPQLSFKRYVRRILKYIQYKDPAIVAFSLILVIRFLDNTKISLTLQNIHRIYAVAILISIKMLDDYSISNNYYAEVTGLELKDLNKMEELFVKTMDFEFYPNTNEINMYIKILGLNQDKLNIL